jgi:large repetitive protein
LQRRSIAINGASGGATVSVLGNDTLNGAVVTVGAGGTVSLTPGTAPTPAAGSIVMNADGTVTVAPGTTAGSYAYSYTICEQLNPSNCSTATATIVVAAAPVVASNDTVTGINGASGQGNVLNAFADDTINGLPATIANASLSLPSGVTVPAGLSFNLATGDVSVVAGTPAGTYSFLYELCEQLNPTNCQTATISVTVAAAPVVATPDTVIGINGATGASNVVNAFAGDTVNSQPATTANATLSLPTGVTVPAGLTFDVSTGNVSVTAATPAGSYSFTYQICEQLNPTNCQTATISVTVDAAPVVATSDAVSGINGATGQANVVNAFAGDTVNGLPAGPTNATLSLPTGVTVPAGLTFDVSTGNVSVAAATPAGSYSFTYQICEQLNPTNCQIATITVTVVAAAIAANADTPASVNGATGNPSLVNVYDNDLLNGAPVSLSTITGSVLTPATPNTPGDPVPVLDPATGVVAVPAATPAGSYTISYQICEQLNPSNCSTASVTVTVDAAPVIATSDTASGINGASGATTLSVLGNDTLNGTPVTLGNVILTPGTAPTSAAGSIAMNPDGTVTVAPGTTAGTYSYPYTICEQLNPTNCNTAIATIVVNPAPLVATDDTPPSINGATGTTILSVLGNDTLNGNPVTLSSVTLTPGTAPTPAAGSIVMNPDGTVTVTSGTTGGTYSYPYTICELLNLTNCETAVATIVIDQAPLVVTNDTPPSINGAAGATTLSVLGNDTLNGSPVTLSTIILSPGTAPSPIAGSITMNPDGTVTVTLGTTAGSYSYSYTLCEQLNPTNCKSAIATVVVDAAPVVASDDASLPINGGTGATTPSVLDNDTLNGNPVTLSTITLTPGPAPTLAAGLIAMNPDGIVTVAPGTTAGTYLYPYSICEKLNPLNCKMATATIVVDAAPVVATSDSVTGINGATGQANVLNAFASDLINGQPATAANAVLSIVTPVPEGLIFNPTTGNVSVAAGTASGTYTFDYQICEKLNPANCKTATETVTVNPVLSGTVFHDVNGNGLLDSGDRPAGAGYVVKLLDATGAVVGAARTGPAGTYRIVAPPGTYTLTFTSPAGVEIGRTTNVSMTTGGAPQNFNLPIDPSGVIYNAVTRAPVAGVKVLLTDASGVALPSVCFLDPAQQNQVTGVDGAYRFDLVPGGDSNCPVGKTEYRIKTVNPAGYQVGFANLIPPQAIALDAAACATAPAACQVSSSANPPPTGLGIYYTTFLLSLNDPQVVNNHIALDPLVVTAGDFTKVAAKSEVHRGESVAYTIQALNVVGNPVRMTDIMPKGFAYVAGSATANGVAVSPVPNLNVLTFDGLVPDASGTIKLELTLTPTAAVVTGPTVNRAQLLDSSFGTELRSASATVNVVTEHVFDCGDIIGKVFDDKNRNGYQDEGEHGLPGVRVVTVKGQLITTDKFGRFHVSCADLPDSKIGSNFVMKLDTRTLPTGYRLTTENPRDVRLTAGKVTKLNFGAAITRVVSLDLNGVVFKKSSLELLPDWRLQLSTLIQTLDVEPSTLRLTYYVDKEGKTIGLQRVAAVQALIAKLWGQAGDNYKLPIETRVISVAGAPSR